MKHATKYLRAELLPVLLLLGCAGEVSRGPSDGVEERDIVSDDVEEQDIVSDDVEEQDIVGTGGCPALASSCPDGCDTIEAAGVTLGLPVDEQCRHRREVLGCYVAPQEEDGRDVCVVDASGEAYAGIASSEAVHLIENGYRDCTLAESSEWMEAIVCNE